jgi:CDP-glycerol glycerophosphotransferase
MTGGRQVYGSHRLEMARNFLSGLFWWFCVAVLARLIPRDHNRLLFYGRDHGKFLDNCKHLYCGFVAAPPVGTHGLYVARDQALVDAIAAAGGHAVRFGGFGEFLAWLRSGTIVVDSTDWPHGFRFAASRGARTVQLWHGIPLKMVQKARVEARGEKPFPKNLVYGLYLYLTGRQNRFDLFLSTSPYVTEHAFSRSFDYRKVSHAGYPRNDILLAPASALSLFCMDLAAERCIAEFRGRRPEGKVVLYAPTFREALDDPFAAGKVDLPAIAAHAAEAGVLLLVKLHPWMHGQVSSSPPPGVMFVSPESDVYPLLREVDALVTDYSSIFFDFLLLDRPVIFFCYDLERYLAEERPMYFDYASMTPGPRARTTRQLGDELLALAAGRDEHRAQRAAVRSLVFTHRDAGAAQRLLRELHPAPAATS